MPYTLKKVGFIAGTHGYKGHLRLKIDPESLINKEYLFILIEEKGVPFFIEDISDSNIVKLKFIENMDDAQSCIGKEVAVETEALDPDDEFGLTGFQINIIGSPSKGIINSVDTYPQGEMLNCTFEGKEVLIPFVEEWIDAIDVKTKVVQVSLPEGLLDI